MQSRSCCVDSHARVWFTVPTRGSVLLNPFELVLRNQRKASFLMTKRMSKRMSRRVILHATLALSLLLVMASWLVTKTTANSKTIMPEWSAIAAAKKDSPLRQPKRLLLRVLPGRHAFQQPVTGEKTIEQVQKNIKVLNGMPPGAIDSDDEPHGWFARSQVQLLPREQCRPVGLCLR